MLFTNTVLGRAIDEHGNLIKEESQVKVLAANVAAASANKKKENPYLAHRTASSSSQVATDTPQMEPVFDDRLKIPKRDLKGKKGLHFIDAGTFVKEADILQQKEERKLIAGYSSGRKNLEVGQLVACYFSEFTVVCIFSAQSS